MSRRAPLAAPSLLAGLLLCGCSGVGDMLSPSALTPARSDAAAPAETAPLASAPAPAAPAQSGQTAPATVAAIPVSLSKARVQLAPIVGAPVQAVAPLTERLAADARASGYRLANNDDPAATHILKGYFSAFGDSDGTTVVYVWDVLDRAGNRLHRIQGQEKASGAGPEAWSKVGATTMQAIADKTIGELTLYLQRAAG